ncbi:hypothetical protein Y900_013245 [Mycolicibacterium aromaticivorans JS19b1 = JCM 16368]|uniref:Oxidoreductase molybdopterin-binding domain-containing protein n=1 Tax=Mycolicibacterium aromaticivorans JS19b1 = JCM 16368 TaxID=1440774 RepID=A0A064CHS4_9MYCO|nr:molybdopterin-dependent oxidoreductase [Mycolicibacterium aromaticivorans]KDE99875.1 hypothetical protein Y900_013245 [Mycolicibacterium aromaticivorans JS19b1 = JCM 16368]
MRNRLLAAIAAGTVGLAVGGCASSPAQDHSSSAAADSESGQGRNPYALGTVDPPAPNAPVLTVTGGTTSLSLTIDQLNAMGHATISIDEPFVNKRETYSGVPLAAVLAVAGIADTATIDTDAIDHYHYVSVVKPMIDSQALIATQRDGAPIPYDQGGPIRIVFPDRTPLSSALEAWNWSLTSITVKHPAGS